VIATNVTTRTQDLAGRIKQEWLQPSIMLRSAINQEPRSTMQN